MAVRAGTLWAVVRAWAEGTPFDVSLVSKLTGYRRPLVEKRLTCDGRRRASASCTDEETSAVRARQLRMRLWSRLDAVTDRAPAEALDKGELDIIQALLRVIDRAETMEQGVGEAVEENKVSDIANTLRKIDARILELAGELAEGQRQGSEEAEEGNQA